MFENIESMMEELIKCKIGIHDLFEETDEFEAIDLYWNSLSHNNKIDFLIQFLNCYFYYPKNKTIILNKPDFPNYNESKKMQIAFEEFRIIIKFILDNSLNGNNVHDMVLFCRYNGCDDNLKNEFEKYSLILPFMPTLFTTQLINNSESLSLGLRNEVIFYPKVMNSVKSYDELIEKLEYYIYIAYYHFIAKYSNTQITQLINKNLVSNVFKYNSDIKRILQEKDKKSFFKQLIDKPQILLDKNL